MGAFEKDEYGVVNNDPLGLTLRYTNSPLSAVSWAEGSVMRWDRPLNQSLDSSEEAAPLGTISEGCRTNVGEVNNNRQFGYSRGT